MLAFGILIFVLKNVFRKSRFNEMVDRKKIGTKNVSSNFPFQSKSVAFKCLHKQKIEYPLPKVHILE